MCETNWYNRFWGVSKSQYLQLTGEPVVFSHFAVSKKMEKMSDGESIETCTLWLKLEAKGRSVSCHYSHLTKDLALFCEGSEPWIYSSNEGPKSFTVSEVVGKEGLNFRSKPSLHAPILTKIPAGTKGLINLKGFIDNKGRMLPLSDSYDRTLYAQPYWCRAKYQKQTGWVACRYIESEG